MVKYDANWEITNTYDNLQIVRSQFFTEYSFIFGLIRISIGSTVFDSMPMNTNKELLGYIWLFVIFGHLFDER